MPGKALVVDANILVRAVLGKRVRQVIEALKPKIICTSSRSNAAAIPRRRSASCAP
jgi:hypothetical protein